MEVERQNTPAQVISRAGRAGKPDLDGLDRGFLPGTCVLSEFLPKRVEL